LAVVVNQRCHPRSRCGLHPQELHPRERARVLDVLARPAHEMRDALDELEMELAVEIQLVAAKA
jgi:truncated hemoglobin YjbI